MAGPSIFLFTKFRKTWGPALTCLLLFATGVLLLAYNNPGFVDQLFGGIALGLSIIAGWLLGIDEGAFPGWFITPGAALCEAEL